MSLHNNKLFLKNKKILLIAPLFFDYYKKIMEEITIAGGQTDFFADAPSNSNFSKALGRINKNLIASSTRRYFNSKVLPSISGKEYDFVLVIAGMTFSLSNDMINRIRIEIPKAKFIIYAWDSVKNLPYFKDIKCYFDLVFSFDREDTVKNANYRFLPLFYSREYEKIGEMTQESYVYDCSYVGTAHPKKFQDINKMANSITLYFPNQYIYHYMPSKLKYYYHKATAIEYKNAKTTDFRYDKIPIDKVMEIFKLSKVILDAPQLGQSGLTMRTLECLGAKRKLITTNKDIVNYDFYCPENVLLFDDNWTKNRIFFTSKYKEINKTIYYKYSLRNWLKSIFEL